MTGEGVAMLMGMSTSHCAKGRLKLPQIIRVARLQNEGAPEKCLNRYEKWFERGSEKGSEKRSETYPKILKPLSRRLNVLTGTSLNVFHRPKLAPVVFHHEALQG